MKIRGNYEYESDFRSNYYVYRLFKNHRIGVVTHLSGVFQLIFPVVSIYKSFRLKIRGQAVDVAIFGIHINSIRCTFDNRS